MFGATPNGNGHGLTAPVELKAAELPPFPAETKQSGVTLSVAPGVQWFAESDPDTGGLHNENIIRFAQGLYAAESDRVARDTAYAAAAYAHVAIRYRMRKVAEPPLFVANQDADGKEEAIAHPLDDLLLEPHPDYDMGELMARTQAYVDIDGSALWLKDLDRAGRTGQLVPFSGSEFTVTETRSRIRGNFHITRQNGELDVGPERVVYFHEISPTSWLEGTSLLDVCLTWLNLGQAAKNAVRDILRNALFPSVVVQTDPDWKPTPDDPQWLEFQEHLRLHASSAQRGEPLALTGGGRATVVTPRLRDLIPEEVLNRVESVVSAVFGIPSIVLQFQVGMENSPWSQMEQARRMCYEDTIEPLWREREKALSRQLLRPVDANRRHFIRFDTSKVRALQADRKLLAEIQEKLKDIASVNERREIVLLEPTDNPAHDEVPEPIAPLQPGALPGQEEGVPPVQSAEKALPRELQWKRFDSFATSMEASWQWEAEMLLAQDRDLALKLFDEHVAPHLKAEDEEKQKPSPRVLLQAMEASMRARWDRSAKRLVTATSQGAVAQLALDLGISFNLVMEGIEDFTQKEAAFLVTSVTETTKQGIRDALAAGITAGENTIQIRNRIADAGAFAKSRALLIARTETTRVTNGSQEEGMRKYASEQEVKAWKQWLTAGDHRVRPDHDEMADKEVPIDGLFDTPDQGLIGYPSAPNCRCTLTYRIET